MTRQVEDKKIIEKETIRKLMDILDNRIADEFESIGDIEKYRLC